MFTFSHYKVINKIYKYKNYIFFKARVVAVITTEGNYVTMTNHRTDMIINVKSDNYT